MNNQRRDIVRLISFIAQIALIMIISIAIGGVLGYYVGLWLNADYMVLIGILLGACSGYSAVYKLVRRYLIQPKEEKKKPLTDRERRLLEAEAEFKKWRDEKELQDERFRS